MPAEFKIERLDTYVLITLVPVDNASFVALPGRVGGVWSAAGAWFAATCLAAGRSTRPMRIPRLGFRSDGSNWGVAGASTSRGFRQDRQVVAEDRAADGRDEVLKAAKTATSQTKRSL